MIYSVIIKEYPYIYVRIYDCDGFDTEDKKLHFRDFDEWKINKLEI